MTKIKTNRNNTNNVPPLRFPEFSGEWRYSLLGNECNILCGYPFDGQDMQESSGNVKLLRGINITEGEIRHSNELDRYYSGDISKLGKYILKEGDLVIGMDGSKVGRNSAILTICEQGSYLVQRVCRIRSQKHNVEYIFQHINNSKFHKYVDSIKTASAIPHISQSDIQDYTISFPPTAEEQIKITSLLSLLDARIATQNKIIEKLETLIKAIGNKCLFGHGRNVRLGDILIERTEKSTINDQYEILSSTIKGIFSQRDYFSKDIASENNIGYKVLHKGDIVLSPQNLWMGNINYNDKFNFGIVSPSYKIFAISEEFDCHYVAFLLKTHRLLYSYRSISEQGASIVRRNLNMDAFLELTFKIPPFVAQRRIGQALSKLNDKIEMERDCLNMLKAQKQYLLSNLFI